MIRPAVGAVGAVVLLVVGGSVVGPAIAASGSTDRGTETVADSPDFDVTVSDTEVDAAGGRTNFTLDGIPPGTPVEVTVPDDRATLTPSLLARAFPGEPTSDGVRFRVPANRTVPFAIPRSASCRGGDFEFVFQRLDTGTVASDDLSVVREDIADASFTRANYTVERNGTVPIHVRNTCLSELTLRLNETGSSANASVSIRNADANTTIWIDTASPPDADRRFRIEATDHRTNATVSAAPLDFETGDQFRLSIRYTEAELATARLRVTNRTADARIRPSTPNRMPTPETTARMTADRPPTSDRTPTTTTATKTGEPPSLSTPASRTASSPAITTTPTTATGPGFGALTALGALLTAATVVRTRRQ